MEFKINDNYKIVDVDSLIEDPENIKIHTEKDISEKKAALKKFGFTRPLIVNSENNIVAAGNGFLRAAKELGYKEVPVIFMAMSPVRAKALAVADNKLADTATYDLERFTATIGEINEWEVDLDWKALGFDKAEIDLLLSSINTEVTEEGSYQQEETPEIAEGDLLAKPIKLTNDQRSLFEQAVKKIRESENDNKISEGKIVELLTAEFLAS